MRYEEFVEELQNYRADNDVADLIEIRDTVSKAGVKRVEIWIAKRRFWFYTYPEIVETIDRSKLIEIGALTGAAAILARDLIK